MCESSAGASVVLQICRLLAETDADAGALLICHILQKCKIAEIRNLIFEELAFCFDSDAKVMKSPAMMRYIFSLSGSVAAGEQVFHFNLGIGSYFICSETLPKVPTLRKSHAVFTLSAFILESRTTPKRTLGVD